MVREYKSTDNWDNTELRKQVAWTDFCLLVNKCLFNKYQCIGRIWSKINFHYNLEMSFEVVANHLLFLNIADIVIYQKEPEDCT